jgi:hypothetical protein
MLRDGTALTIGLVSLAAGILIGLFAQCDYEGFSLSAFLSGVLVGLSLVMNIYHLWRTGKRTSS